MFVAFLALDAKRTEAGLRDCCCCTPCAIQAEDKAESKAEEATAVVPGAGKTAEAPVEREGKLRVFLRDTYAPFLLKPVVKAAVCFIFAVIAAVSVYGVTKVPH